MKAHSFAWGCIVVAFALLIAACGTDIAELGEASQTAANDGAGAAGQNDAATNAGGSDDGREAGAAAGSNDADQSSSPDGAPPEGSLPIDPGPFQGTDALEPGPATAPPTGWVLYAARAEVSVPGGTLAFGGPFSSCGAIAAADGQVVFTSNFQRDEVKNLAPHLGYADRGDGFAIWGLYIGEGGDRGEEWSGTGQGTPTLTGAEGAFALIAPGGITFDPAGEGIEPDGRALLLSADWSGEANENFTAETGPASIEVRCLFVSTELLDILAAASARNE